MANELYPEDGYVAYAIGRHLDYEAEKAERIGNHRRVPILDVDLLIGAVLFGAHLGLALALRVECGELRLSLSDPLQQDRLSGRILLGYLLLVGKPPLGNGPELARSGERSLAQAAHPM